MPKIIPISGKKAIKKLEKIGYKVVRQSGSHMRMWHFFDKKKKPLTIPNHKIMRDADITVAEFNSL